MPDVGAVADVVYSPRTTSPVESGALTLSRYVPAGAFSSAKVPSLLVWRASAAPDVGTARTVRPPSATGVGSNLAEEPAGGELDVDVVDGGFGLGDVDVGRNVVRGAAPVGDESGRGDEPDRPRTDDGLECVVAVGVGDRECRGSTIAGRHDRHVGNGLIVDVGDGAGDDARVGQCHVRVALV